MIAASENEIKVLPFKRKTYKRRSLVDANKKKVYIIQPRLKIVAAFYTKYEDDAKSMFCFETDDSQLDPNHLKINKIKSDSIDYNFI